jgi:hypothetical protein
LCSIFRQANPPEFFLYASIVEDIVFEYGVVILEQGWHCVKFRVCKLASLKGESKEYAFKFISMKDSASKR